MDPNATLKLIHEAIANATDHESVDEWCHHLFVWISRGGFEPDWDKYPMGTSYYNCRAITERKFASIKVLYRQNDTMVLWGIPYEMRSEVHQQPADLYRAGNTRGWMVLNERDDDVKFFLEDKIVPTYPNEWSKV